MSIIYTDCIYKNN